MGRLIELIPLPYTDAVVALGAAILGLTAGVLGAFAVLRERSLVGDALAHAALPGVALAFLLTGVKDTGALLVGAGVAGIAAALLMVAIERTSRVRADAAIGVVMSGFFALGVVLLTYISNLNDADQAGLERYLFGQAAGLLERDLVVMTALSAAALLVVAVGFRALKVTLFDPAFAASVGLPVRALEVGMTALLVVAIMVGVRTVGAILMVALLVAPTAAARQLTGRLSHTLALAGLLGAAIGVAGSLLSMRAEVPTGPVIVLVGFCVVVAALLMAPGRGLLWRAGTLRRERCRARDEALLVDLDAALRSGRRPTLDELAAASARPRRASARALRSLERRGLVRRDGEALSLTATGAAAADDLRERRELWTLWLEHGAALELPDAREPDPRDLRASLGAELVERLRGLAAAAEAGR